MSQQSHHILLTIQALLLRYDIMATQINQTIQLCKGYVIDCFRNFSISYSVIYLKVKITLQNKIAL